MESKLNYLVAKIDKIDEKLDTVLEHNRNTDVTLARQNVTLEHHVLRSDKIEEYVNKLEERIAPLEKHTTMTQAIAKVTSIALAGVGTMFTIYKIVMHFL